MSFLSSLPGILILDLSPLSGTSRDRNQPRLKSAEERKNEALSKLHKLPIEFFYTKEEYLSWPVSKIQTELKRRGLAWKYDTKDKMVEALVQTTDSSGETCSICYDDYESEDVLRVMPCGHRFHIECVDKWIISSTDYSKPVSCPNCKKEL